MKQYWNQFLRTPTQNKKKKNQIKWNVHLIHISIMIMQRITMYAEYFSEEIKE